MATKIKEIKNKFVIAFQYFLIKECTFVFQITNTESTFLFNPIIFLHCRSKQQSRHGQRSQSNLRKSHGVGFSQNNQAQQNNAAMNISS